jgi:hypothetical protein
MAIQLPGLVRGWQFNYQGCSENKAAQIGATQDNLFLAGRKGCLDKNLLKKYRLTQQQMQACDSLLFHHLLLPICAPERSYIAGDQPDGCYMKVM